VINFPFAKYGQNDFSSEPFVAPRRGKYGPFSAGEMFMVVVTV
jgi:hypothetical protein